MGIKITAVAQPVASHRHDFFFLVGKVLVNLGAEPPDGGESFERIIEIVSAEGEERQRARARWRAYETRGWAIKHHAGAAG